MPRARALWAFSSADGGVPWNSDIKLPELEAILAASVLPGGRLVSSENAVADGSDQLLARALLNAHSESIAVAQAPTK